MKMSITETGEAPGAGSVVCVNRMQVNAFTCGGDRLTPFPGTHLPTATD